MIRKLSGLTLHAAVEKLNDRIWDILPDKHPAWRKRLLALLRFTVAVLRDMREGGFDQRAASLSYTTLLSFAPLLAVTFSVLKGFGVHDVIEPFLRSFLEPLGGSADEVTQRLLEFVEKIQMSVLGSVGVALLLYGLIAMMQKIEAAFNDIWRVAETRNFVQRVRDYLSVLMIGPLCLFLSAGMTAALRHASFAEQWLHIDLEGSACGAAFFDIVPYVLFMLAFTALYMFMPNTRVRPMPALAAGFVTGVVWKVLGKLFGIFVTGSASYAAIYSAFAALVLLMIWVYAGWLTVLAGAAIAYYLQNPSNQPLSRKFKNLSLRMKEKIALQSCAEIGHEFYKGQKGLSLVELSARLKMPALAIYDVVEDLVRQGILAATGTHTVHFIPGRPFDTTSVEFLLQSIRSADETGVLKTQKVHTSAAVNTVIKLSDKAIHKELGKFTLKQLALGSIES